MPQTGYYVAGDWDACCDQCGRSFKFSALSKRWDNAWTCDACWEPRHPQDFVRAVRDDPSVPVVRPRPAPQSAPMFWTSNIAVPLLWTNATGLLILWTGS